MSDDMARCLGTDAPTCGSCWRLLVGGMVDDRRVVHMSAPPVDESGNCEWYSNATPLSDTRGR